MGLDKPTAQSSPRLRGRSPRSPRSPPQKESDTADCDSEASTSSYEEDLHASRGTFDDPTMENLSANLSNNASISVRHRRHSSPASRYSDRAYSPALSPSPCEKRSSHPHPSSCSLCFALLAFAIVALVLTFLWGSQTALSPKRRPPDLSAVKEELSGAFPGQPAASWRLFSAMLRPILSEQPPALPAILLLVGRPDSRTLACVASRLAETAAIQLGAASCRSVTLPAGTPTSGHTSKVALEREVMGAYARGERCFRLDRPELLSQPELLLLHSWGDGDFSPMKRAFLMLVVSLEGSPDEREVERFLLQSWADKVGEDEAWALNSRLANNVLVLKEEENLSESSCLSPN